MDYSYLYKKFNHRTPFIKDCGSLCQNACCEDTSGEEMGMYLFPGEETQFLEEPGFRVEESALFNGKEPAKILFCEPYCNRNKRPLSCRIFPLFPYISKGGKLRVILDPRGRGLCPITQVTQPKFAPGFYRGVRHIGKALMKEKETRRFLWILSRLLDEEIKMQNKLL